MARATRPTKPFTSAPTGRRRHTTRNEPRPPPSEVYTYSAPDPTADPEAGPSRARRQPADDEDAIARVARMIASEDAGMVDDDEEVESDDAWSEGDEERWGDLRDGRKKVSS